MKKMIPGGSKRMIHVFLPLLKDKATAPVWAIRSESNKFRWMMLVNHVKAWGPTQSELLTEPLSGTAGRGVAVMTTDQALEITWEIGDRPIMVDTWGKTPEALAQEVKALLAKRSGDFGCPRRKAA